MPSRADIVAAARGWLGTRWHHQGRVKGAGVDCIGLVVGVARELDLDVQDRTDYGRRPDSRELMEALGLQLEPTPELLPGDVVLFEVDGQPQHVGIRTDVGLIHAYAPSRKVIEHGFVEGWPGPTVAAYRFPGVA